jgi:hypothetical protein
MTGASLRLSSSSAGPPSGQTTHQAAIVLDLHLLPRAIGQPYELLIADADRRAWTVVHELDLISGEPGGSVPEVDVHGDVVDRVADDDLIQVAE